MAYTPIHKIDQQWIWKAKLTAIDQGGTMSQKKVHSGHVTFHPKNIGEQNASLLRVHLYSTVTMHRQS